MKLAVTLSPPLIGQRMISWPLIGCYPATAPLDYWPSMWTFLIVWHFRSVWRVTRERLDRADMWQLTTPTQARQQDTQLWTTLSDYDNFGKIAHHAEIIAALWIPLLSSGKLLRQWAQQGKKDKRNVEAERSTFLCLTYQWYLVSICLRKAS